MHVNVTSLQPLGAADRRGARGRDAQAEIEKLAQGSGNVRDITNELQVGTPSSLGARANDSYITTKVKGRLLDSNKVNPIHVKVVTEAGVVYLMGIVTEQEADDAVESPATPAAWQGGADLRATARSAMAPSAAR